MDLSRDGYTSSFSLLLACLIISCGSICVGNIEEGVSAKFQRKRLRRQLTGYCGSPDQCTGNTTVFPVENNNRCHCDEACFKTFSDCCPDYKRHCGLQESSEIQSKTKWKCVELSWSPTWPCLNEGVTGVWMINKCSVSWPFDKLRSKCENAPTEFSYPVEDFIPVVDESGKTFRNKHCALCNKVNDYTTWKIGVFTFVIPPDELDIDSRLKFVENNGGMIQNISPRGDHPRRFCFGRNYIANCSFGADSRSIKACVEGSIEVVTSTLDGKYLYFKNFACAACNGHRRLNEWKTGEVCEPILPEGFSVVFNIDDKKPITNVVQRYCPQGSVYDTTLKFCREGHIVSSTDELTDEYLMLLWFSQPRSRHNRRSRSKLENHLKLALTSRFLLLDNQISHMAFHRQDERNNLLVSSFRLTLTPFQTLLTANQNMTSLNVTPQENTAFLELLHFTGNISLDWKNSSFSVVKVISKRLSCYGKKNFQRNEYEINRKNGTLVVNRTGEIFFLQDYTAFEENDGNITLCSKLVFSDCNEGAYVPLRRDEYVIFPNLSIYYNTTMTIIHFGEYQIHELLNKGKSNTSDLALSTNVTISVCLSLSNTYHGTETDYSTATSSDGVRIVTLIGFSISIFCLALLLLTYGLFQELRSVPGLNLMNLSLPTLLSNLIWLIGTSHYVGTKTCEVLAIFEHYFLLVSFLAMSIISFHSYRVFAHPIVGRTVNKSRQGFIKYSVILWITPAIFVAICVALDKSNTLLVGYGTRCWLGTKNAKLFLFLLPLAMLLLCNIFTFIHTAISLSRHEQNRTTLQLKEGKQNLLICAKLATLVGFPWLFMFFLVLFPDEEAFEYLFVIFVCLQGLYIGLAFLFTKKVSKLYKERFNIGSTGNTSSSSTAMTLRTK